MLEVVFQILITVIIIAVIVTTAFFAVPVLFSV